MKCSQKRDIFEISNAFPAQIAKVLCVCVCVCVVGVGGGGGGGKGGGKGSFRWYNFHLFSRFQ